MAVEKISSEQFQVDLGPLSWAWMMAIANMPSQESVGPVLPEPRVHWAFRPLWDLGKAFQDTGGNPALVMPLLKILNVKFAESCVRLYSSIEEHNKAGWSKIENGAIEWYLGLLADLYIECRKFALKCTNLNDEENLEEDFIEKATEYLKSGLSKYGPDPADIVKVWNDISARVLGNATATRSSLSEESQGQFAPPATAPEGQLFGTHRRDGEDVVGFIDRVYGKAGYLTGAFTRADLRKIDPDAVAALEIWEQGTRTRPKGRAPLNLPTRTERNNQLRNADPATLTEAEKIARNRLLAIQRYEAKKHTKN